MMASKKCSFLVFLIILIRKECQGNIFSLGSCPILTRDTIASANPPFSAPAYEFASLPSWDRHGWKCTTWATAPTITDSQYILAIVGTKFGAPVSITGTITYVGTVAASVLTGGLLINYNSVLRSPKKMMYYALDNTPEWTVLYACMNEGFGKIEDLVILTTERKASGGTASGSIGAVIENLIPSPEFGINLLKNLQLITQTGC